MTLSPDERSLVSPGGQRGQQSDGLWTGSNDCTRGGIRAPFSEVFPGSADRGKRLCGSESDVEARVSQFGWHGSNGVYLLVGARRSAGQFRITPILSGACVSTGSRTRNDRPSGLTAYCSISGEGSWRRVVNNWRGCSNRTRPAQFDGRAEQRALGIQVIQLAAIALPDGLDAAVGGDLHTLPVRGKRCDVHLPSTRFVRVVCDRVAVRCKSCLINRAARRTPHDRCRPRPVDGNGLQLACFANEQDAAVRGHVIQQTAVTEQHGFPPIGPEPDDTQWTTSDGQVPRVHPPGVSLTLRGERQLRLEAAWYVQQPQMDALIREAGKCEPLGHRLTRRT